jgi:hypothetical protein
VKPKLLLGLALVLSGGLFGCSTNRRHEVPPLTVEQARRVTGICKALDSADSVIVYALDPSKLSDDDAFGFHRVGIESSLVIENLSARKTIARMLRHDLGNDDESYSGKLCFSPYYGLRIVAGGINYDLVISAECGHVLIYSSGRALDRLSIASRKTEDFLDSILVAANIPHLSRPN